MGDTVRFGAAEARKQKRSPLQTLWGVVLRVAPASNLLGGLMLMTSFFLPHHAQPAQSASASARPAAVASAQPVMTAVQKQQAENTLAEIRDLLVTLGWTLGGAGLLAGKINVMAAGKTGKQPSMVLGGLWGMGVATWLMFDPTLPVRTAFLTASALLISGYANKVRNDFGLKNGEKPREFDMRPLYSPKVLRALTGDENASGAKLLRAWVKQLKAMSLFVAEDHALMVKDSGKAIARFVRNPKTNFKPREWLKPSALQNRLGAMLIYAGGVPLLIMNGNTSAVEQAAHALIATGSLTADLSLFAVGKEKKGALGKAMMVGVLATNAGIAGFNTTAGAGLSMTGNATVDYYFAKEAERDESAPDSSQESAQDSD